MSVIEIYLILNLIYIMPSRLLLMEFSKNAKTIFINGKRYTRSEFKKAQLLEKRRLKNGRFTSLSR